MTEETEPFERPTLAQYVADRKKLLALRAPRGVMYVTDDERDVAFRQQQSLEYALATIGHLLRRIEELEARVLTES